MLINAKIKDLFYKKEERKGKGEKKEERGK